jgi:hypothetical protein
MFSYLTYGSDFPGSTLVELFKTFIILSLSLVKFTVKNSPNPFNPITVISFSLRNITLVTLKIYDVLGREVDVLINEVLNEGNHQIIFNGSNFESGMYFYEISTNNFRDVKKFILIK